VSQLTTNSVCGKFIISEVYTDELFNGFKISSTVPLVKEETPQKLNW
jgi:hypothetical protein